MIKGLAITPPIIGRISIGRVVERNGQRLPAKDDQFTQHGSAHRANGESSGKGRFERHINSSDGYRDPQSRD